MLIQHASNFMKYSAHNIKIKYINSINGITINTSYFNQLMCAMLSTMNLEFMKALTDITVLHLCDCPH